MAAFLYASALLLSSTALAQIIPLAPAIDPFYVPPAGFEYTDPGTVLASRSFIPSFLGLVPDPVAGYQILYTTTAANGSIIAEVTSIFVPTNAQTDKFISFQTAYDSAATICNPSYNYQLLAVQTDLISSLEMILLQGYLLGGYIVSSPDYEGPDAAFGAGRLAGTGVLDSMRAVTNFYENLGIQVATETPAIVGVGYSGGAIATGWAASLASTYAPDLPVVGWAMGGTPANLTGTAYYIDDTPFSGFLPTSIVGLSTPSAYGSTLQPFINSITTPYAKTILGLAAINCAPVDLLTFGGQSIFSTNFQSLGKNLFYEPTIRTVLEAQTMGVNSTLTPQAPVFIYHTSQDEIIPYSNASALVSAWCADGATVNFTTIASGGHFGGEILGFSDVYTFVGDAFAGTVSATGACSAQTTYGDPTNLVGDIADLEPLVAGLSELMGEIGTEDDENVKNDVGKVKTTVVTGT